MGEDEAETFFASLDAGCTIAQAARAAGVDVDTVNARRTNDPAFAERAAFLVAVSDDARWAVFL